MEDAPLAKHHEDLTSADYNRTKQGLGFSGVQGVSRPGERAAAASVAAHYNSLGDRHRTLSHGSNILQLRNLNNWIKSVLIGNHIAPNHAVLDLACGKGGDLLKFQHGRCGYYVGIDIALQSVRDAVARYNGASGCGSPPPDYSPCGHGRGPRERTRIEQLASLQARCHAVPCSVRSRGLQCRRARRLSPTRDPVQPRFMPGERSCVILPGGCMRGVFVLRGGER
jgi:hypothetical protein